MEVKPNKSPEKQAADKLGITVTEYRRARRDVNQAKKDAQVGIIKHMHHVEGYSIETLAHLLEIPESTVRRLANS